MCLGLFGGLIIAEIGALIPETGGMIPYLEKMYSRFFGFAVAWAQTLAFYPIRIAAAAVVFGLQTVSLFHLSSAWTIPIALAITAWLALLTLLGNKASSIFINTATFLKYVPMLLIIIFGLFINGSPSPIEFTPVTSMDHPVVQGLAVGVIACLYATDGWIHITDISGEIKNPERNIPRAIVWGVITVTITYLVINVAYLRAMTPAEMAGSSTVGSDAAARLMGDFGAKVVAIGILISIMGSQAAFVRSAWRVPYALSLRNWLPFSSWFSKVSSKSQVPINAGIYTTVVTALAIIFIREFNVLTDIGTFVIWIFYTLCFIGLFILRRKWPDRERYYKVPLYPVIPIIGVASGILVIVVNFMYQPAIALFSLFLILLGVPVFIYKSKQGHLR